MRTTSITGQRLAAVFLLGCVLLNYPLLFLFNSRAQWLGVPLLYAYLFAVWCLLVGLMAWLIERRTE